MCVCLSAILILNILEAKRFRGLCPIGSLWESSYRASIGDVIYDVIFVTSQYSKSSHSETRIGSAICVDSLSMLKISSFDLELWEKKHLE